MLLARSKFVINCWQHWLPLLKIVPHTQCLMLVFRGPLGEIYCIVCLLFNLTFHFESAYFENQSHFKQCL